MGTSKGSIHLLKQLRLPSRYENLSALVGADVASLLVEPTEATLDVFRRASNRVYGRGRGIFLPLFAPSGTGKTTLVSNLTHWLPNEFGPTVTLSGGEVTAERLRNAVWQGVREKKVPADDKRIYIVNMDDRESDPPSDRELSQIKSFVRENGEGVNGVGCRTIVVWPETSEPIAESMAMEYEQRAGRSPVEIPARIEGPERTIWPNIVVMTMKLVNSVERLEDVGVNPHSYDPAGFETIGDFMDAISNDFIDFLEELITATRKPVQLVVAFASESGKPGVLSEFTSGRRYGLVDADKLVAATPSSVIGKWWGSHMGLLVQTIVRLDARVTHIPPTLSVAVLSRYGPEDARTLLADLDYPTRTPGDVQTYFERSDFGRLLSGTSKSTVEARGNPGLDAAAAYSMIGTEIGFNGAKDKALNRAFANFFNERFDQATDVECEKKVPGMPLIPDLSYINDEAYRCIEFHWRSGEYLVSKYRSDVAQYVLKKLKSYALELGWILD